MLRTVRAFLLIEGVAFALAASVHFGILFTGFEHRNAGIAESIISAVLFAGLLLGLARPEWTRPTAFVAQGFALAGVFVGLFTISVGVGPQSLPDVVYHVAIALVLALGLIVSWRGGAESTTRSVA